jgi:hypothetical protein
LHQTTPPQLATQNTALIEYVLCPSYPTVGYIASKKCRYNYFYSFFLETKSQELYGYTGKNRSHLREEFLKGAKDLVIAHLGTGKAEDPYRASESSSHGGRLQL